MKTLTILFAALLLAVAPARATAQDIAAPTGPVVLTISGDLDVTNVDDTLQFDYAALEELDDTVIVTSTPWTEGVHRFQGVSLHVLATRLNLSGGALVATAMNDYSIEIPISDAIAGGPIIAYALDGKAMTVRDKGPLWVIYPFDQSEEFRTEVVKSRSIWQLDRLTVID